MNASSDEFVTPAPMLEPEGSPEWHDHESDCDEAGCEPVYIPKDAARRRAWCAAHGLTDEEREAVEEYVRICEQAADFGRSGS